MLESLRLPSLVSIRAFEAAARLGSFARAAQELDTTAASVSYHVRRLEQQVGAALFVRHAQRVELTEAGDIVAREATQAFAALRASFVRAVDVDESRLSLTALPTFGSSWLTPRLGRFRTLHPQITLELEVSPEAQELGTGRFDAAIRNGHGHWPGLRTLELFPSVFMPLCAPALRDAAAGLDSPRTLPALPLLGRPDWWRLWFRALGHDETIPPQRFGIQLATEHLDVAAAIAGHGVAIGSPLLFRAEIAAGRLVPAHPAVAGDGRGFWFAWPAIRHASRKLARFRDWLAQEAEAEREASRGWLARAVIIDARG